VRLYVEAPGAGSVSASAEGAVASAASHSARAAARHGRPRAKHAQASASVVERVLAAAKGAIAASEGGLVELTLTLAPSYRALASTSGGLSGVVSVVFSATGHPALRQNIVVSFLSKAKTSRVKPARSSRRAAAKARHRR
jgi:hypothetical protein